MTQLSKERLEYYANNEPPFGYTGSDIQEMARRLLDAEAQVDEVARQAGINPAVAEAYMQGYHDSESRKPAQPVAVPDDVLKRLLPDAEKSEFWFEHDGKILFEGVKFNDAVFEACRAAMLNAEPVSQPYTLPENVRDALTKALQAMEFMGDTLNNLDAVCAEDVEFVTPAFDAVREVLATPQEPTK